MLTTENINGLADLIDEAIKLKNPILEGIDGTVAKFLLKFADQYLDNAIPEEFHEEINTTLAEVLEKDYEQAIRELMELISEILIKYVIPKLTRDSQ